MYSVTWHKTPRCETPQNRWTDKQLPWKEQGQPNHGPRVFGVKSLGVDLARGEFGVNMKYVVPTTYKQLPLAFFV